MPAREGYTYHSDIQKTRLRARQFVTLLLLRWALYSRDGHRDRKDDGDLTAAYPQVSCLLDHYRLFDAKSWAETWHDARRVRWRAGNSGWQYSTL
jgi:hypothetical protein